VAVSTSSRRRDIRSGDSHGAFPGSCTPLEYTDRCDPTSLSHDPGRVPSDRGSRLLFPSTTIPPAHASSPTRTSRCAHRESAMPSSAHAQMTYGSSRPRRPPGVSSPQSNGPEDCPGAIGPISNSELVEERRSLTARCRNLRGHASSAGQPIAAERPPRSTPRWASRCIDCQRAGRAPSRVNHRNGRRAPPPRPTLPPPFESRAEDPSWRANPPPLVPYGPPEGTRLPFKSPRCRSSRNRGIQIRGASSRPVASLVIRGNGHVVITYPRRAKPPPTVSAPAPARPAGSARRSW